MTDVGTLVTGWTPATLSEKLAKPLGEVEDALETALVLLERQLEDRWRAVPTPLFDVMVYRLVRAILQGDKRQYTGAATTQVEAGQQVATPRDPLDAVAPLVRAYVVGLA